MFTTIQKEKNVLRLFVFWKKYYKARAQTFSRDQYWPTLNLWFHANGRNIVALCFAGHRTIEMLGLVGPKVWPVSNCTQQVPTLLWFHANGRNKSQHCWAQQCWVLVAGQQCWVRLHGPLLSLTTVSVRIKMASLVGNLYLMIGFLFQRCSDQYSVRTGIKYVCAS